MKKTAFAQAGIFVLFVFCFISMNSIYRDTNILPITNNITKNPKLKTIIYDASKGINTTHLLKNLKQLDIFDNNGRKVLSINKFEATIYLNTLRTGAYSIKLITTDGDVEYRKLIKQ